jgi:hypothetical protein
MISETHVGGTELRYRWDHFTDTDYQEKDPGKVRILMLRETRGVCLCVEFLYAHKHSVGCSNIHTHKHRAGVAVWN